VTVRRVAHVAPPPLASPPPVVPPSPVVSPPPVTSAAETLLLALARSVSARAGQIVHTPDVTAVAETVGAAYAPDAALTIALRDSATDKTAQLALGWAREQMRLALREIVESARAARVMRTDTDADTLAWLWLAACESLAHETPTAVADRVHALTAFLTARER
jgi:hypothetical protein